LLQNQYVAEILLHPVTKYFHVYDLKMSFNCYIQINNIILEQFLMQYSSMPFEFQFHVLLYASMSTFTYLNP
jgi:hypothetical protein